MSQRELPLWARGVAALLLLFASWWLVRTETLRAMVGDSIALLSLGIVAASILRGMGLPLGLWPSGPWRKEFAMRVVLALAGVFGVMLVLGRPWVSAELVARLDRGTYVTVIAGVIAWGFTWALVRQRSYLAWYSLAAGAAVVPLAVALVALRLREGGWSQLCVLSAGVRSGATVCDISVVRGFAFLTAVDAATALVTVELAFRRLLIGQPRGGGLVLILGAAAAAAVWSGVVTADLAGLWSPLWFVIVSCIGAGCFYVLSRSLLVSSLYTALLSSGYHAIAYGDGTLGHVASSVYALGGVLSILCIAVVVALSALVVRRNGFLGGIR